MIHSANCCHKDCKLLFCMFVVLKASLYNLFNTAGFTLLFSQHTVVGHIFQVKSVYCFNCLRCDYDMITYPIILIIK